MKKLYGILFCAAIATGAWFLGNLFSLIGAPVFAILIGMVLHYIIKDTSLLKYGITFSTKKVLQLAVILLGFGLTIQTVVKVGISAFPIIITTILGALLCAYICAKCLRIPTKIATLIGVGTSICGGSAIAATAPVIKAEDEEVAQAISVIFLFNILAVFIFPQIGEWLGFSNDGFALFAGTAVNDTSSVTAVASLWDISHDTGTRVLDYATVVKLTRTLAIIPITLGLAIYHNKTQQTKTNHRLSQLFPKFIIYFVCASLLTSVLTSLPLSFDVQVMIKSIFSYLKEASKFFIVMAMAGIGFNTNVIHLIKTGKSSLLLGLLCWISVSVLSIIMQSLFQLF
ncbi:MULTISPECIES: YeiH family protein [unclassified Granulicatella]|uniref:YeiH family protein n=1 Tax=unclassified Granulicatella TaxID=2630493 RepID=UPI0010747459|nr:MULTISPECIES: YeiH family protein [unclassified Granulicatella]MBF0780328.1 YeiH family putative sulfate export transporter [Granulicatella sp. 19428wC4_WM01]TFU95555.1 YeiH family putative sulfate export transporter [Granulicatella sp. WM01]